MGAFGFGLSPISLNLSPSFVVVFNPDNVVLAEIIAKLNFNEGQQLLAGISQPMVGTWRNEQMLTRRQLRFAIAADDIGDAINNHPMFAATRVTLKTQSRARFYLKPFDFEAITLIENFISAPWSLVSLAAQNGSPLSFLQSQLNDNRCRE